MSAPEPARRPFTGSCHCGKTKYIVFLTIPHTPPPLSSLHLPGQKMYKCNCTNCQKAAYLHLRLDNAAADFLLLSPLDPRESLGDYRCNTGEFHFFFCKSCGGKCFLFCGGHEVAEVPLDDIGIDAGKLGDGVQVGDGKIKVWRGKQGVFDESKRMGFLSVNAHTLDAGQEGMDLREWHEKGWILYLDGLAGKGKPQYGTAHEGGVY